MAREVNKLPGIHSVTFQFRRKLATVTFDPRVVTAEEVIAAINRANEEMRRANPQGETAGPGGGA